MATTYRVTDEQLTAVADAIRGKKGIASGLEFPDGFVSAVGSITAELSITPGSSGSRQSAITVPAGGSVELFFVFPDMGPIKSWEFSVSFSGKDNLIVYSKNGMFYVCNPTGSSITIPNKTSISIQYDHYSASIA